MAHKLQLFHILSRYEILMEAIQYVKHFTMPFQCLLFTDLLIYSRTRQIISVKKADFIVTNYPKSMKFYELSMEINDELNYESLL